VVDPPVLTNVTEQFEEHRSRLRAVAYRLLGSLSEADDAVQETWLRLNRTDASEIDNLGAWLTTVVARVSLNMLRSRRARREELVDEQHLPEPILDRADGIDPEHEVLLADAVGLALLVVLENLSPPERLAFVLHDMFSVPFSEIAAIAGRTPAASRQLASRARRRVRGSAPVPDPDLRRQRAVVDAYLAAARDGRFDDLVAVLDPEVVLRVDRGGEEGPLVVHGAQHVARQALRGAPVGAVAHPALINGGAGWLVTSDGAPIAVAAFTVADGRVVELDILADRERLAQLDLSGFGVR
jgi:RNA polymerase sigma factor (sigma-70 family)